MGAASQCIAWPIWRTSRQGEGDGEDDLAEALRDEPVGFAAELAEVRRASTGPKRRV
jgi:hypothetical protein